jgi:hypothetical protein
VFRVVHILVYGLFNDADTVRRHMAGLLLNNELGNMCQGSGRGMI